MRPNYIVYGKMQHDRAGHARHEGPVLPSGEREPGLIARGPLTTSTPADVDSAAEPLGGFLHQASSDLRVVRRGHSSFPPARGLQSAVLYPREVPTHVRSLCSERVIQVNRGRLGRDVDQGLT